ncbi:MAG: hypothetical protein MRZ79_01755 [Bacteroidia bacterium]|nr:hypothetical protein [Bacteroidia bacterium]
MKTFLVPLLLVSLTTAILQAQHIEDCAYNYEALKKAVYLEPDQVSPDKAIFLSESYVKALKEGVYGTQASNLIYYEYVRPASKKELKTQKIENPGREKIASDGKIYIPKSLSGHYHFFKPTKIFKGNYRPSWNDPNLVVPMGLKPFDVLLFAGKKFWIIEKKTDYLLLEVDKQQLVYFIDYPKMEDVFETEEIKASISAKAEHASRLLGKEWFIQHEETPTFRSAETGLTAPQDLFFLAPLIELNFTKTKVDQLQTTLFTEDDSIKINDESKFVILDKTCVLGQQTSYAERLMESFEEDNEGLRKALKYSSVEEWVKDPWVKETLFKRFWLLPSKRHKSSYQYVLLDNEINYENYLFANTDFEGSVRLTSHFASQDGLYHNRILIFKGNRRDSLESSRVSTRNRNSARTYTGDSIVEEIDFDKARDQALLKTIAYNTHRKIRVRFKAGGKYYKDIVLDDFYKQQIRDVYMLSQILKNTPFAQGEPKD